MDALISTLPGWLQQVSGWEMLAVLLGLAYLLLAMRESIWCSYSSASVSSTLHLGTSFSKGSGPILVQ